MFTSHCQQQAIFHNLPHTVLKLLTFLLHLTNWLRAIELPVKLCSGNTFHIFPPECKTFTYIHLTNDFPFFGSCTIPTSWGMEPSSGGWHVDIGHVRNAKGTLFDTC